MVPETEGGSNAAGVEFSLAIPGGLSPSGAIHWDATGLTFDTTEDSETAQAETRHKTLQDIVTGNEWRLRRIVGKFFCAVGATYAGTTSIPLADVALGFIVSKTYDDGEPLTDFDEVNPLAQVSMEDPWIWRRRWLLGPSGDNYSTWTNYEGTSADNRLYGPAMGFPPNNVAYGSVQDGPHIDAKTARVIHRSERLFVVLAARQFNWSAGVDQADMRVTGLLDYRLLGSLRSSSYGNRGNASR